MLKSTSINDQLSNLYKHHHNLANHLTTLHLTLAMAGSSKFLSPEDFDLLNRLVEMLQNDLMVARDSAFGLEETLQKPDANQQTQIIPFIREVA